MQHINVNDVTRSTCEHLMNSDNTGQDHDDPQEGTRPPTWDFSPLPDHIYCPMCGYSLRSAQGDRCSECGYYLEGLRDETSRIPWVYHKLQGWLVSYWRTVWAVTFANTAFCEEYARKVDLTQARRFQWATIAHVSLILLVCLVIMSGGHTPDPRFPTTVSMFFPTFTAAPTIWEQASDEGWPFAVLFVCLVLLLLMSTSLPGYFFHPSGINVSRQNAAVALSHYLCAPLAIAPLIMLGILPLLWMTDFSEKYGSRSLWVIAGSFAIAVALWWLTLVRTARRIFPQLPNRTWSVGICVPLSWLGCVMVFMGLLPMSIMFVMVVISSLG